MMKQQLNISSDLSVQELKDKIFRGARFVVFQYCVSIFFFVTSRRFSPAILIETEDDIFKYRKKYNLMSLFLGFWGIPLGPIYAIMSLNINNKGGIDVTDDIMLNLTEKGLENREIELIKTTELFCKPGKSDLKAFYNAFSGDVERDYNIKRLVVGIFINTKEGTAPFFTIGLKVEKNYDRYIESLKPALYRYFRKRTYFEFIDLSEDVEINRLLEKQGVTIINRETGI